jgi:hypothetical protein
MLFLISATWWRTEMKVRVAASTVIAAVAASFLMVLVVPVGGAVAASPNITPGPSYTLWAYGAIRTVDFSGVSARGWAYQGSATYGYSVIFDQTNLTSDTFELTANRTMGAALSVEYCETSCKSPSVTATINYRAWEAVDAWANFTTDGTVFENGVATPALALMNSHSTVVGNLTDSAKGPVRSGYLSAAVSASANVAFATPLGLIPDNLQSGVSWNSTSEFNASGEYALTYFYHYQGTIVNTTVGPETTSGQVARSGNVSVVGSVRPGSVSLDKTPYENVSLLVLGPFDAREGFLLVPSEADLFASAPSGTAGEQTGTAIAQMSSIDIRPGPGAHLGIGGSEWVYSASTLNPSVSSIGSAPEGSGGVTQLAAGADNVSSTPVQGVPIPVDQASQYQNCFVSGAGCPSGAAPRLIPFVGIGAAVVVIAVVALAVVVVQRRRVPPPSYPNAKLYPPGSPTPGRPPGAGQAPSPPPPPPAEDDPLSNLW